MRLFWHVAVCGCLVGAAAPARAQAGGPGLAQRVESARAFSRRCDFAGARSALRDVLGDATRQWKPGDPGFLVIQQDLATFSNNLFDWKDAEAHARIAVDLAGQRFGADSREQAIVSQNLAVALSGQGRAAEARTIFTRIEPILKADKDAAPAINLEIAFGGADYAAGRSQSGLAHMEAAARMAREADVPAALKATALLRVADAYRRALRFADATHAADEAGAALGDRTGARSPRLQLARAAIAQERGRLADALGIVAAIHAGGVAADPCDPTLAVDIAHREGSVRMLRREVPEASAAFTTALAALVALKAPDPAREGEITYGLAVVTTMMRDYARASSLFANAATLFRRAYGPGSEAEAQTLIERSQMLSGSGDTAGAVTAAKAALSILQAGVEQGPLALAYAHAALGLAARLDGRIDLAERELDLALSAFREARGAASFDLTPGLSALGEIALSGGRWADAQAKFRRAADIQRRWGGESALALGSSLSRLALAIAGDGRRDEALRQSAAAVAVLQRRLAIGEARPWNDAEAERTASRSILVTDLELASALLRPSQPARDPATVRRLAADVQLVNATVTGAAIAQMSSRLRQSNPETAALLGERDDLSSEWRAIQDALIGNVAAPGREADDGRQDALLARQQAIAARIAAIDSQLARRDPRLELLVKSKIADLAAIQGALHAKEAAVLVSTVEKQSYVVVATRDGALAFRAPIGTDEMTRLVRRLRVALDPEQWGGITLPAYDSKAAAMLYEALLAPAADLLKGCDSLLVVPDGPLSGLPLTVLLTEPAPPVTHYRQYKDLPWLVRRFAVTTFPSAASIVALRALAPETVSQRPMLGVGDPQFAGPSDASGAPARRGAILRQAAFSRLADVAMLRQLPPLPNTKRELEDIAGSLGKERARLLLGADASERAVRAMPLAPFGVIVFATHGLVAGDLAGYAEPALALTPPAKPSEADDGLLSASEIALLKLRADWVILSACNTAAGDGTPDAKPLSGLAKSFFYAGARSLLVTHWSVDTEAAAALSASTVSRAAAGLTPAQALRRTELDFIEDKNGEDRTHPFFWAPFSLIGG